MTTTIPQQVDRAQIYILNNWTRIFPKNFYFIASEIGVIGSLTNPDDDDRSVWRIDFMAGWGGRKYVIECDIRPSAQNIWHCYKAFAYRAAIVIDRCENINDYVAMAFIGQDIFSSRNRNILAVSGLEYCVFGNRENSWYVRECSLWKKNRK